MKCPRCPGLVVASRYDDEDAVCLHCGWVKIKPVIDVLTGKPAKALPKGKPGRPRWDA